MCAVANTDLTLTLLFLEPKSFSKPRRIPTPISHPAPLPNDKGLWSSQDLASHKEGRGKVLHQGGKMPTLSSAPSSTALSKKFESPRTWEVQI